MKHCPNLNLPRFECAVKTENTKDLIFDVFRKKWLHLTPEEWVRQQLLMYLHHALGYPMQNIVLEKQIEINGLKKRFDALITGPKGRILMLIECKKPEIELSEKSFLQLAHYNSFVKAEYLLMSNGMRHIPCRIDLKNNKLDFIDHLPEFLELENNTR
ncbi:MAG: type I restriction enzyme HsdR N-terminal domain-containing protein [Bacteroidales bacterium]|nr:type I restriction enzyme HsdR N-terminal domain-containing protein [Bacteroidales bacterium]